MSHALYGSLERAAAAYVRLAEQFCHRTEAGDTGLQQVQADKHREQQPQRRDSALSQRPAVLRDDDPVYTRREARSIFYSLPEGPAQEILATMHGIYCGG